MKFRHLIVAAMLAATTAPASAALSLGTKAPDFSLQATLGGNVFTFNLADALKKGPVVLYFYPAAFTTGCTIEAHDFADAIDQYKALGATVIGVSHDPLDTLQKFSVSDCRSKFAVAADTEPNGDEGVRCGAAPASAVREPHVVRHRARRNDHLHVHEPRSIASRPEHADRAEGVESRSRFRDDHSIRQASATSSLRGGYALTRTV